jgi:hypothetical protein
MQGLLLRHEDALAMPARAQALLVDLAGSPVLRDDEAAKFNIRSSSSMPLGDSGAISQSTVSSTHSGPRGRMRTLRT